MLRIALRLKMPKTIEKVIQEFTGKDDIEIHQFIYDIAKDKFTLETKNKKLFSEQELKDKLKKAEKRIDEIKYLFICEVHNHSLDLCGMKELKQILNDCFGVGK